MAVFPKLRPDKLIEGRLEGHFKTFTGRVSVSLNQDDVSTSVEELARSVVKRFSEVESIAKNAVTDEYLDVYNESWRVDSGAKIHTPFLTGPGFKINLVTEAIEMRGEHEFCFWFNTKNMFGGHSIVATFEEGIEGTVRCALFG